MMLIFELYCGITVYSSYFEIVIISDNRSGFSCPDQTGP